MENKKLMDVLYHLVTQLPKIFTALRSSKLAHGIGLIGLGTSTYFAAQPVFWEVVITLLDYQFLEKYTSPKASMLGEIIGAVIILLGLWIVFKASISSNLKETTDFHKELEPLMRKKNRTPEFNHRIQTLFYRIFKCKPPVPVINQIWRCPDPDLAAYYYRKGKTQLDKSHLSVQVNTTKLTRNIQLLSIIYWFFAVLIIAVLVTDAVYTGYFSQERHIWLIQASMTIITFGGFTMCSAILAMKSRSCALHLNELISS
mgnify:CR=1 FL=1